MKLIHLERVLSEGEDTLFTFYYLFTSKMRLNTCKLECMNTYFGFEGFFGVLKHCTNKQPFEEMNTGKNSGVCVLLN